MKGLFKIIRRYVLTAMLITALALSFNFALFCLWGLRLSDDRHSISVRRQIDLIAGELEEKDGVYRMSEEGLRQIKVSVFQWGMLVKGDGQVGWTYELPPEIPRSYTLADMSVLSKWYLKDYPVFTWTYGDGVLVMGQGKESVARFNLEYSVRFLDHMPEVFFSIVALNLLLIFLLALFFGYRFYRALRPVAQGIERLSNNEAASLPEKGMVEELSRRLNQTSQILERQNRQLAKRDNARTNWIAGVSHDIRTPLSLILGHADSLGRNPALDEDGRRKAQAISRQSMYIKKLIEDLNLTSKLEYDAQPLRMEEIRPASFLRQIAADYYNEEMLGDCQLDLAVDENVERAQIQADKGLLTRAFQNLIGNSVRHAPGCLIWIQMKREGSWLSFLFQDSGPGIPPEAAAIAEGRLENPNIHVMGLRVARQIVAAHGGRMEFALRDGKRLGVRLLLPLSSEENVNA